MKFRGFYFGDTTSGLARWISPNRDKIQRVAVPVDRTVSFRKLPTKSPNALPRECEFEVEDWLAQKPDYESFTPVVKENYRKKELSNKWDFHIRHCHQCAAEATNCPVGQHILDQIAAL